MFIERFIIGLASELIIGFLSFASSDELQEGSKALHDVLELDLPNLRKINSGKTPVSHLTDCDRCGRSLYA